MFAYCWLRNFPNIILLQGNIPGLFHENVLPPKEADQTSSAGEDIGLLSESSLRGSLIDDVNEGARMMLTKRRRRKSSTNSSPKGVLSNGEREIIALDEKNTETKASSPRTSKRSIRNIFSKFTQPK